MANNLAVNRSKEILNGGAVRGSYGRKDSDPPIACPMGRMFGWLVGWEIDASFDTCSLCLRRPLMATWLPERGSAGGWSVSHEWRENSCC